MTEPKASVKELKQLVGRLSDSDSFFFRDGILMLKCDTEESESFGEEQPLEEFLSYWVEYKVDAEPGEKRE